MDPSYEIDGCMDRLADGGLALVVDPGRNCADLVAIARSVSADVVNAMTIHGRGMVSVAITPEQCRRLELRAMPGSAEALASVEASAGVDTGISAADRALTIRTVADPASRPDSLICPGHVVPLVAAAGGLLSRAGRKEAAVDLAGLADSPAAAICEVLDDAGGLADAAYARTLAEEIDVPLVSVAAVIKARIDSTVAGW
jgi:3,4-dihydroxy 2-butanone 4-phosphate synthase/GTP cyclohydrolase II